MQLTELKQIESGEMMPTKANARLVADEIVKRHAEGELNALQTYIRLTGVEETCKAAKEGLKPAVLSQLAKYPKGATKELSAKAETTEAGVKYDYSQDATWCKLNERLETYKALLKGRETFLKGITKPLEVIDPETGEVSTIYPPTKTSTETPKITLS